MASRKSSKVDISGMVYDEQQIDQMIAKVKLYKEQTGKSFSDLAVDAGYGINCHTEISKFLKKHKTFSEDHMKGIFKRFQDFFAKLEAAGEVVEPDHPLQILVDQLTRENEKLKNAVETLEYIVDQRDDKIAKLEKNLHESPAASHLCGPSSSRTIYETPVKAEVFSQPSQNTLDNNAKESRHIMLKNQIKEIIADLQEQRRRRTCKTYLIVDANGTGKYAGKRIQELRARLKNHSGPASQISSKNLKAWIATQSHLTAYVIHEGSEEECALVESVLINLGPELGFDLLNERKEKSRLETPTKFLELDDDNEISVLIGSLPMKEEDPGHDQFVADVRYMIENAMEQQPVRHSKNGVVRNLEARAKLYSINKRRSKESDKIDESDTEIEKPAKKRARKESESEEEDGEEFESDNLRHI